MSLVKKLAQIPGGAAIPAHTHANADANPPPTMEPHCIARPKRRLRVALNKPARQARSARPTSPRARPSPVDAHEAYFAVNRARRALLGDVRALIEVGISTGDELMTQTGYELLCCLAQLDLRDLAINGPGLGPRPRTAAERTAAEEPGETERAASNRAPRDAAAT